VKSVKYEQGQGTFKEVIPKRPVFSGAPGAVKLVARFSNIDKDSPTDLRRLVQEIRTDGQ